MSDLLIDVDAGVALVTLNRPDRLNAMTRGMVVDLWEAFVDLDARDDVRAIVVTGSGRAFCAGQDLEPDDGVAFTGKPGVYRHRPWALRTPVIGALNGPAVGVGLTLATQWDVRIVAEDAKLGFVFVRRGLVPEANSAWLLPRLVGMARAAELMLTGRHFTGAEAASLGLATEALPAQDVLPRALELARDIAENTSPVMVAATKQLLWRSLLEPDLPTASALDQETYAWVQQQPDLREGVGAFLERRAPVWPSPKSADLPAALASSPDGANQAEAESASSRP